MIQACNSATSLTWLESGVALSEPALLDPTDKAVKSLVEDSLTQAKELVEALALADGAFKASEAKGAEKQQEGEEQIRHLELEFEESRQRNETLALEAVAVAIQLESAIQQLAQSSVLYCGKTSWMELRELHFRPYSRPTFTKPRRAAISLNYFLIR
jgi:hypothetical protein